MGESVEDGTGEAFVAEDLGPVFERQVGGEDDARAFVGVGDDIEQKFSAGLARGNITEFVEDEKVEFAQLAAEAEKLAILVGGAPPTDPTVFAVAAVIAGPSLLRLWRKKNNS